MNPKALVAEFIGTFALIFVGVGSIVVLSGADKNAALVGVALAHGITIAVFASATGGISGGHLNPAVTFGAFIGKKITAAAMIGYWIAQILGGVIGAFAVKGLFPTDASDAAKLGIPALGASTSTGQGLFLELIGTFFLVFVVFGTAIDKRAPKVGALFIGLTITVSILCFGPLTGCAINPARYLGPAVVRGDFSQLMPFIVGDLAGGALAGLVYAYFLSEPENSTAS